MDNDISNASISEVSICDTELHPARHAFGAFREAVANAFMPWSLEQPAENEFSARIASFSTESISFGRFRMTPLVAIRKEREISKSPELCLYANYVISGQLVIEQGDRTTVANEGDLIIYDSALPVKLIELGEPSYEDLAFKVPKCKIASKGRTIENVAISRAKLVTPLASCLKFLSRNMLSSSPDELAALGSACSALLPVATSYSDNSQSNTSLDVIPHRRVIEMIRYIDANLANNKLSPSVVAEYLGISVRYVHKQFAFIGITFSDYVRTKRLEFISLDLISHRGRREPIGHLAFRWGFNDLSTFARSFKEKFGCSPREYRLKF